MAKVIGIIMVINVLLVIYFGNGMFNNFDKVSERRVTQLEQVR